MILNKYLKTKHIITLIVISTTSWLIIRNFYCRDTKKKYFKYKIEAKKYFDDGAKYKAIEYGYKCIKENPNNVNGYFFLINSLIDVANYDEATNFINIVKNKCTSEKDKNTYDKLCNTLEKNKKELKKYTDLNIVKDFLAELYKNGAKIKKTKIGYSKNGIRGLFATENINKDETLIEIPLELLITNEQAGEYIVNKYSKESKMSKEEIKSIFDKCYATSKFKIILYILENDKVKSSTYHNIIKSSTIETFPNYISDNDVKLLENTDAINLINSKKEVLDHDINLLYKIKSVKKFPFDLLKKYYFIISSRLFTVTSNGKSLMALVPYIDMLNHNNNIDNFILWDYDENKKCFCAKTDNYIDEGEEIFDSYGTKSNTELYITYGFTQEENRRKSVTLEFNNNKYECIETYDHKKNKLPELLNNIKEYITNKEQNLSTKEIEIIKFLKFIEICENKLNKYKTKLKDDIKERESNNISINKYNILNVLISEKELLNQFISSSNKCIKFLKKYGVNEINDKINADKDLDDISVSFLKNLISQNNLQ